MRVYPPEAAPKATRAVLLFVLFNVFVLGLDFSIRHFSVFFCTFFTKLIVKFLRSNKLTIIFFV